MQSPFPAISEDLIKKLDEIFPKTDFNTQKSLRDIDFHGGQRSVVNFLRGKREEQTDNILKLE